MLLAKQAADALHVWRRRIEREHAHHADILVVPGRPMRSIPFKYPNLIVQCAKPVRVLVRRAIVDRAELAHPQGHVMLLGKLRALGIQEESLLFCQIPLLGTTPRSGPG